MKVPRELAFFLPALGVVTADQLTKLWVRASLSLGQSLPQEGFFRLTHVRNTGAAFGLLANQTFLIVLTALVIGVLLFSYRQPFLSAGFIRVGMGLMLGGGVGNLIDRLRLGYVTDLIDLRVWPVFNLADSAIVVGSALVLFFLLVKKEKPP